MKNHVCIRATDTVWGGMSLTMELHDWLIANVGQPASNMTEFVWDKKARYYMRATQTSQNPLYVATGDKVLSMIGAQYLHFDFHDATAALLFKLTWGGR